MKVYLSDARTGSGTLPPTSNVILNEVKDLASSKDVSFIFEN